MYHDIKVLEQKKAMDLTYEELLKLVFHRIRCSTGPECTSFGLQDDVADAIREAALARAPIK